MHIYLGTLWLLVTHPHLVVILITQHHHKVATADISCSYKNEARKHCPLSLILVQKILLDMKTTLHSLQATTQMWQFTKCVQKYYAVLHCAKNLALFASIHSENFIKWMFLKLWKLMNHFWCFMNCKHAYGRAGLIRRLTNNKLSWPLWQ